MRISLLIAVLAALALTLFLWTRGENSTSSPVAPAATKSPQRVGAQAGLTEQAPSDAPRTSEVRPGTSAEAAPADVVLGTIEALPVGTLIVRMETTAGELIRSGWKVNGQWHGRDLNAGAFHFSQPVAPDPTTGFARIENLPPGPVKLHVSAQGQAIDAPTVEVVALREVEVALRYDAPDKSRRIIVVPYTSPFYSHAVDVSAIHLVRPDGRRESYRGHANTQHFTFDDLIPGNYTVEIDDPRYEPFIKQGVEPGATVHARLRGAARVRLEVKDAATAAAVPRYELKLRFGDNARQSNEVQLLATSKVPPADGAFAVLAATPVTLILTAEGYAQLEFPLGELVAGESRDVIARLSRGAALLGRVVLADGVTPVANAQVCATAAGMQVPFANNERVGQDTSAWTTTDASGRFEITQLPPGSWAAHGTANLWLTATLDPLVLAEGEQREIVITLPC